jgi:hypothetical protein
MQLVISRKAARSIEMDKNLFIFVEFNWNGPNKFDAAAG